MQELSQLKSEINSVISESRSVRFYLDDYSNKKLDQSMFNIEEELESSIDIIIDNLKELQSLVEVARSIVRKK